MHKTLKLFTIFLSLIILSGCSSLSGLKFWGDDEEEIELPAVLEEITQKISISSLWDAKVGKEKIQGRISPSISGERIFYINAEGELFAFEKSNGRKLWEKETDDQASGGIETAFRKIIYGTLDGEVVVLNQENGEETWRAQATSEILSSPITNGSVVVAQGADGSVTGFDFDDGEQSWIHQVTVPNLSLRGTSTPILEQGFIFTGFANGTVAMIYPDSGAVRLELPITINEAASELERIVDIDGKVVVASDVLVSASYQGHITAIDLQQGRPIWQEKASTTKDLVEVRSRVVAIDDKDILKAFGLSSGVVLWQQEGLKLRGLTSPVSVRGNIAVGDFEGYIHIINGGDGSFLGRFRASKNPIVEIVSEGDKLAITDDKGRLFFLSLT
jgi:outer membrane protein assembly factor BamB|tara:strand:- start:1084 stop:2247 length:1164 start_codon:yes stop_codon:yes gene_type:complete